MINGPFAHILYTAFEDTTRTGVFNFYVSTVMWAQATHSRGACPGRAAR